MVNAGKYEYQEAVLGRDAQGTLYEGRDTKTGAPVFIKLASDALQEGAYLWPEASGAPGLLLARENIREKKARFLVAERPEGILLSELLLKLRNSGIFGRYRMLKIFLDVCEAVRTLHAQGLVHGFVHPGNVLVQDSNGLRVYLICFRPLEMSTACVDPAGNEYLVYLSPEQLRGLGNAASDIYALGMLLHFMFGTNHPYAGVSNYELAERIMWGNFITFQPDFEGLEPPRDQAISPELNTIGIVANKAIQRSPYARFGSVADLAGILSQVMPRLSPIALGIRLIEKGRLEQAAAVLEEAVHVEDPAMANLYLGRIYGLSMGNYEKGVAAFKRALKANSELEAARLGLAELYSRFGHHALAKNEFAEMLDKYPNNVQLLTGYANVLNDTGNYEGALNVLTNVQRIDPFNIAAYCEAIHIALTNNDQAKAESFCNHAIEQILKVIQKGNLPREQVSEVYFYRATLHRMAGRSEQTLKWLKHSLEQNPRNIASHIMLVELYQEQGEPEEALRHILAALSLDPGRQDVLKSLAKIYEKTSE